MMKHLTYMGVLLGILFSLPTVGLAQFEENYEPILFRGSIPDDILQRTQERTMAEIRDDESGLTENQQREFYTISNYALRQAFLSGNVYFNDEISEYLSNIVDHLLFQEPELRDKIQIFATRFSTPNAVCWRNGTVFFNISLKPYLDNEAQIAYI